MGGCFSLPDPALEDPPNGQPPQPDATPAANSLCQSIWDFFKKCLFSKCCCGGSNNSMVTELQRAKADIQRYELELADFKSQNERMHGRSHGVNLNQFEFENPRVVRGTDNSAVDRKDGESSCSNTVRAWSINRDESSSSKTVRAWSMNKSTG